MIDDLQEQNAILRRLLRQRGGLLGEVEVSGDAEYATVEQLATLDDLPEVDLIIKRWQASGKRLKLRVRALDLDQQESIDIESTIKHPQTGEWVRSDAVYCAATLEQAVTVPKLNRAQAHTMRKHNPAIIKEVVSFIWNLSGLDDAFLEKLIHLDDPPAPDSAELSAPSE